MVYDVTESTNSVTQDLGSNPSSNDYLAMIQGKSNSTWSDMASPIKQV